MAVNPRTYEFLDDILEVMYRMTPEERVVAIVLQRSDVDLETLQAWCRNHDKGNSNMIYTIMNYTGKDISELTQDVIKGLVEHAA